jgi:hypothetical protein
MLSVPATRSTTGLVTRLRPRLPGTPHVPGCPPGGSRFGGESIFTPVSGDRARAGDRLFQDLLDIHRLSTVRAELSPGGPGFSTGSPQDSPPPDGLPRLRGRPARRRRPGIDDRPRCWSGQGWSGQGWSGQADAGRLRQGEVCCTGYGRGGCAPGVVVRQNECGDKMPPKITVNDHSVRAPAARSQESRPVAGADAMSIIRASGGESRQIDKGSWLLLPETI